MIVRDSELWKAEWKFKATVVQRFDVKLQHPV